MNSDAWTDLFMELRNISSEIPFWWRHVLFKAWILGFTCKFYFFKDDLNAIHINWHFCWSWNLFPIIVQKLTDLWYYITFSWRGAHFCVFLVACATVTIMIHTNSYPASLGTIVKNYYAIFQKSPFDDVNMFYSRHQRWFLARVLKGLLSISESVVSQRSWSSHHIKFPRKVQFG